MADGWSGWDLHAVVSSCTAAAPSTVPINNQINSTQDPLPDFSFLSFNTDDSTPLCNYPDFDDESNFQLEGLEEIYKSCNSLLSPPQQPINPTSSSSSISLLGNQQQSQSPPHQQHRQQLINPLLKNSGATSSSLALPTARSRRRKNQQTKVVRRMTHEELLADSWAWRKYGQKPIKGSPYPRNYYRCSTSKGCAARRQVEKSPSDPNIFMVSYAGEHTHPRPTHRNSLAGSTRNKYSNTARKPTPAENPSQPPSAAVAAPNPSPSSSSPASASSFSPSAPIVEGESATPGHTQLTETIEIEEEEEEEEVGETEYDDDIDLIPNAVMNEDILKGFEEIRRGFSNSRSP